MDIIDAGLWFTYGLFFVVVIAVVLLPFLNALKSPKSIVKSGIGLGVLLVIFLISYALSSAEVTPKYTALGVGEGSSKLIGAGLTMFYFVLIFAVIGVVFSEINKALK